MDKKKIDKKSKLKKRFETALILTVIVTCIVVYCIFKIEMAVPDPIFGYLGTLVDYFILVICMIVLYIVWFIYFHAYSIIMVEKKYRKVPIIIMSIIGVIFIMLIFFN